MKNAPANDTGELARNFVQTWHDMMLPFSPAAGVRKAEAPADMQQILLQMSALWSGMPMTPAQADKRFADEAWHDPRFSYLRESYLACSRFVMHALESAQIDKDAKRQIGFAVKQVIDAISPANFFATNPEAIQLALQTNGTSLADGIGLFLEDMSKGRISQTDENAFEVGKNLAVTEGDVVYQNELIQLIQYAPLTAQVGERPLLMVPPCINKFYILDLQPENSLVRYAVEQGHTVFMLSWRNITPDLGYLTWDDYLHKGVLQAIGVVSDISGQEKINALGFCIGGTLLACASAILRQQGVDKVASLTLLTTMLDFCDTGELGMLMDANAVAQKESLIGSGGVLQGKELAATFSSLRANDLIWPYVVNSYLKGKSPAAFDLLYWNADSTNLPGPMYTWYLRNAYVENNLCKAGRTVQCGVPVDLSRLDMPAYIYASREDHIVPWQTAFTSGRLLTGDKTFALGASGHIAGVINPVSKNKRNFWIDGNAEGQLDAWLSDARSEPGSWWVHWSAWLAQHAGAQVPAREKTGNRRYRKIEAAPGSYVRQKAD